MKFIDLFAGIGGFRIALEEHGMKCVMSSENNKACVTTYIDNFDDEPLGNIREITKEDIPDHDILVGGFPCQPFSMAGHRKGFDDDRGNIFFEITKTLRAKLPSYFILENVRGIRGHNLDTVINALVAEGYYVRVQSLNSKNFGLPQSRERIFLVGSRKPIHFNFPSATGEETKVGNILSQEVDDSFTISDLLWKSHQARKIRNQKRGVGFGYSLVTKDDPCTRTLSSRYYKDGSEILLQQDGKNPRLLTPRECARLQGFPEDFKLHQNKIESYKQLGNAVSVPVVSAIVKQLLQA